MIKKIWPIKSTTVRSLFNLSPQLTALWAQSTFTRTRPRPLPILGRTELPQHTWRLPAEGQELMVYAWGSLESSAPVALVAHGWNSCAFALYPLIERLRKLGYTVVGFDQVGHGRSTGRHTNVPQFARNFERVARSLPQVDAFLGHSMGAAAGTVALARGLKLKKAVLLAPPADVREYLGRFAQAVGLSPEVQKLILARLEHQEKVELARLVPEELVGHLNLPVLIVCDRGDRETGLDSAQRYERHWKGSRLLVTEGLGHNRILQSPEVLGEVAAFLG